MSLQFLISLGLASLLLFIGVCPSMKARLGVEGLIALTIRITALTAAAFIFLSCFAQSVGCSLTLNMVLDTVASWVKHWVGIWLPRL